MTKLGTTGDLSKAAELFGSLEQIKYIDGYQIFERAFI